MRTPRSWYPRRLGHRNRSGNNERASSGSRQGATSERSRSKIQTRRFSNGCDRNIVDPNIRTAYVSQEQAQAMVEDDGWIVRRVTICESAFPGK
jgi:hypothetical protein